MSKPPNVRVDQVAAVREAIVVPNTLDEKLAGGNSGTTSCSPRPPT
jgi:hypothetical protein